MNEFLTVKEAVKLIGKSESTIKRILREMSSRPDHPDRSSVIPDAAELTRRKEAGEPYVWKIEKSFLERRFEPKRKDAESDSSPQSHPVDDAIIAVLREQLQSKDRQIETLERQLDKKDEQIGDYNERMKETNVLMRELQRRLAIPSPASDGQIVVETSRISELVA